jgi:hypothetical protein
MLVKDLIKVLLTLPEDALVVLAHDSEGNSFSPAADYGVGRYEAETKYWGQFGLTELTPDLRAEGYTEEDVADGPEAICLWPTN